MSKDVSVIICTWNSASRLRITLDALAQCVVPSELDWELVLVNNNCTDDTDVVAADFESRLPLEYVHEPRPGLSNARNAGLAAASGKLIIFTDDDVRPYRGWLESYWEAFRRNERDFYFGGPVESEFEEEAPSLELLKTAPWSVQGLDYGPEEKTGTGISFIGPNWACPREALDAAGGFNASLGLVGGSGGISVGEESDLMSRLRDKGWKPLYVPGARLRHFVPADKTTPAHIGARQQAYGYDLIVNRKGGRRGSRFTLLGVPAGLYKRLARAWLGFALQRVQGRKGYGHFVAGRQALGEFRGYRHLRNNGR